MPVIIQQVDLDTCLTALICGASELDEIICRPGGATYEELADPQVLCTEAGGSGDVEHNNFDHHDTALKLPPACVQAFQLHGEPPRLARLVEYVAAVDSATPVPPVKGMRLSSVFSGMRFAVADPQEQLRRGLALLRTVLDEDIDPFGPMPERQEWAHYRAAKAANARLRDAVRSKATLLASRLGQRIGFVETTFIGALGVLYELGCDIAVAFNPGFGNPPVRKFTIGGNAVRRIRVDRLLTQLNALEPGWGGPAHGTIIASPRTGSQLEPETAVRVALDLRAAECQFPHAWRA